MAIDVKSYGAKGDGIQDDTIYINSAITAAIVSKQDLFISEGTYLCNTFTSGSHELLLNQNGTKKIRIYGEANTKITTSQPSGSTFYVYYSTVDTTIENIFFENTHPITSAQTNAIVLAGLAQNAIKNFTIKNCRFEGFSTAISAQGVVGLNIINNQFASPLGHDNAQNNVQPAVFIWLADNANGQCFDVNISNNVANGYSGVDITKTTTRLPMDGFVYGTAYGIKINGNTTRNLGQEHISVAPQSTFPILNYPVLIEDNIIYQTIPTGCTLTSNYGIRADCNNVTIKDNNLYDYSLGILVYPYQYPTLKQHSYFISGNKFFSPRSSYYNVLEAIKIQGSTNNAACNIVVSDNFVDIDGVTMQSSRSAISIYNASKVNIKNNTVYAQNVVLNGFTLGDFLISNCNNVTDQNNASVLV